MNKGFIYINNSLIGALVLFAKKKGDLRFYMDYQDLNDITSKDRYLLLLIKETLNNIVKVRYFTKLNITAVFYKIYIIEG